MSTPESLKEQVQAAFKYIPSNEEYRRANQKAAFFIPVALGLYFAMIESLGVINQPNWIFKAGLIVFSTMSLTFVIAAIFAHFAGKWSKK